MSLYFFPSWKNIWHVSLGFSLIPWKPAATFSKDLCFLSREWEGMQSVHARLQTFFQPAALPSPSRLSSAETQLLQPAWKEMPLFQKSAADRDWLRCTHDLLQEGKTIPLTSHKKNSPQTRVSVWRSLAVQTISKSVPKIQLKQSFLYASAFTSTFVILSEGLFWDYSNEANADFSCMVPTV